MPAPYSGPICEQLTNVLESIHLSESGLILEVADSIVAPGGRGLFVRLAPGAAPVTLDACSPFCGYATGGMAAAADVSCGKTVAFHLASLSTAVFFEGQLLTVRQILNGHSDGQGQGAADVRAIAGHVAVRDTSGALVGIEADAEYTGPRYFVPSADEGELSIMNLGQMANDLAIGDHGLTVGDSNAEAESRAEYTARSRDANILVLVQRLERDPDDPATLRPSRPISTISREVTIANERPMEVGCEYGGRYWGEGK